MAKENAKRNGNTSRRKNKEADTVEEVTKAKKKYSSNKNSKKKEEKIIDVEEEIIDEVIDEDEVDSDLEIFDEDEDVDDDIDEDEDLDDEDEEDLDDDIDEDEDLNEDIVEDVDDEIDEDEEDLDDEDEEDSDEDEDIDDDEIDEEDEDLDDFDDEDDDEEEVKIKEVKPKKDKKDKKKEKEEKENIKRIERLAKEKKKVTKSKKDSNLSKILLFLDKYRYPIYTFVAGVLISVFVAMLLWPDRIATLKDGTQPVVKVGGKTYTANNLYEKMKDYYSVSLLLDQIDNDLLTKLYPEDDAMTKKIQENAEYYLNMYKQYYNYTQEEFLEKNGFSSYEAFLEYLRLDYRRNKYLDDYVEKNLSDNEIQKYYDDNVYGDINTQHVLVEVKSSDDDKSDKLSDADAKKLAEEIITKLNDGTSWDTIKKDYKDKVTFEDLGYQSWDASLEESFMTALKGMEDNSYSKEPVKTSYGYHVIYRLDQKKKPSLKNAKEKVINKMVADKKSKDSNLLYKSLISLRNEKKIKFSDTVMQGKYDAYCKQYNK